MEQVDVVIVGGGPAGSAAGYAAASNGANAVVIEKGIPRADRDGLGPDSTDAAGILDYWVDLMDLDEPIPDHVKHRELQAAEFIGPTDTLELTDTSIESTYPNFGFTVHRARFDDWLRDRAENAGASYRVGTAVADVTVSLTGRPEHTVELRDGTELTADFLILADGPQRPITGTVLQEWLSEDHMARLASRRANHIAYQEYREFPPEVFEADRIKFWWGYIPGHTAYPWVFPNDGTVARVGLTMPIGMEFNDVAHPEQYQLLREDDDRLPQPPTYLHRLLEAAYPDYHLEDFPLLEDRGKADGTETYPISSTRPIESPTSANIAIVGGAMGATSAFHEGGDHVAIRTGHIAGQLAANGTMAAYNSEWQTAIGDEIRRNCVFAKMVRGYEPTDWDRLFSLISRVQRHTDLSARDIGASGLTGAKLFIQYLYYKFRFRETGYVQLPEETYKVT